MALPGRTTRRGEYNDTATAEATATGQPEPEVEETAEEAPPAEGWTKKATPPGKYFKFQNPGDTLEGVLKNFFTSEYQGKESVNATLVVKGKDVGIRLSQQLQQYFDDGVEIGARVKIVYKGRLGKLKDYEFYFAQ
jgi:hypothetical protein